MFGKRFLSVVTGVLAFSFALAAETTGVCAVENLIHRWSFNGSLVDACGGNTARFDGGGCRWDDADHPTGVTLP